MKEGLRAGVGLCAVLAMGLATVGCKSGATKPDDFTRVISAEIGNYIGKKLELNGNYIKLADDGTFSGSWNNEPIAGEWEMKEDYWCRVLTEFFQPERLNQEDCQVWEASGSSLRGTRNKGSGQSYVYSVE